MGIASNVVILYSIIKEVHRRSIEPRMTLKIKMARSPEELFLENPHRTTFIEVVIKFGGQAE